MKRSIIWTLDSHVLQKLLDDSQSFVDVLVKLGLSPYSGNHRTLRERLKSEVFNLEKINRNRQIYHASKNSFILGKFSDDEVFVVGSKISRHNLKQRLIKLGVAYKCVECGIADVYNNKPITLQLDHINGINDDDYDRR